MTFVRKYYLATVLTAALLSSHQGMAAGLELANLFSDHLVLQRDREAPVWGWAEPGEEVTVVFGEQRKSAVADATGKWLVNLDPMPANAVPRQLTAISSKSPAGVTVENVLVGEVWLGSGQSNMAMQMSGCRDFAEEQRTAQWPLIRMFTERSSPGIEPRSITTGNWVVCSPKTVGSFSGALYCFGREIHRELNVPVGLINSSVGGTPIESWIPVEVQTQAPELRARHEALLREWQTFDVAAAEKEHEKAMVLWEKDVAAATEAGTPPPRRPYPGALRQHQRQGPPGGLFNGKIAPLVPCALRGILWYQGEHNAYWETAGLYEHQLPLLVQSWRERWGAELPFAWVQLPNLARGKEWALVREGMLKTLRLPKTGMAVTIDIGEAHNIHPGNKQDVGKRLALWALGEVYGRDVPATSGPLPGGFEIRGAEVVLSFTHTDGGLQAKGGELTGFLLAGADRRWLPARARIENNQVIVSHPEVESPVAVRYAFDGDPQCNLINGAGLPASPFRTDDWPVTAATTMAGPKIPASAARAKLQLAHGFTSGMVLQRDVAVQLTGWATAGERVVVKLGDQVVAETVGKGSGKAWRVKLPVLHAGPVRDITIEAGDMITLTNLLAGDVWVCSGQSNMAQTLKCGPWCPYGGVLNGDAEIAAANYPRIRLFTAGGKEVWAPCTPESAAKFSAAGYFFGRELQRELNVPIGLMQAAIGGTPAEYWTPRAAREAWPGFAAELAAAKLVLQELKPRFDLHRQAAAEWPKAVAEARKKGLPLPERPVASLTREQEELVRAAIHTDTVGQGYAARIKPLTAMTIKGVIWYQGEANTMRADKYRELMSHLISGWRADWGQDSLPFLIMQLVNFGGADGGWAELRAAQQAVVDTVANTGLAVGIDIGDPKNIHPDNKQDVGKRLAMVALKQVYDKDVVASGPRLETAEFAVGRVILNFDPGGRDQHLIFKPESGSGFEVAGADGRFRSVTSVEATGNTLILACPQIAEPRSVRYAWTDNAAATLFNTPGLPAAPFRQTAKAKIDR